MPCDRRFDNHRSREDSYPVTADPRTFDQPLCAETDPDLFFTEKKGGTYSKTAIALCHKCAHRIDCAEFAINHYDLDGLWGGLTPTQRLHIRRQQGIKGTSILT